MPYIALGDIEAEELGQRVTALREQQQLSQRQLAERAQVPRAAVSALERGRYDPELRQLRRLARILHIGVGELVEPTPHTALCQALAHLQAVVAMPVTVCRRAEPPGAAGPRGEAQA